MSGMDACVLHGIHFFFGCHCIRAGEYESLQLSVLFLALGTRRMIAFSRVSCLHSRMFVFVPKQ